MIAQFLPREMHGECPLDLQVHPTIMKAAQKNDSNTSNKTQITTAKEKIPKFLASYDAEKAPQIKPACSCIAVIRQEIKPQQEILSKQTEKIDFRKKRLPTVPMRKMASTAMEEQEISPPMCPSIDASSVLGPPQFQSVFFFLSKLF